MWGFMSGRLRGGGSGWDMVGGVLAAMDVQEGCSLANGEITELELWKGKLKHPVVDSDRSG